MNNSQATSVATGVSLFSCLRTCNRDAEGPLQSEVTACREELSVSAYFLHLPTSYFPALL